MPKREVKLSLDISALRKAAGLTEAQLPDDASDEQVNEVLTTLGSGTGNPDAPAAGEPDPGLPREDTADAGATGPGGEQQPPAPKASSGSKREPAQLPGGLVVDAEVWRQTQEELGVVRAERERRQTEEDQNFLRAAVKAGKIPPARIDHYMTLIKADRDGTREFIEKLPDSLPVMEYGDLGGLDDTLKASDYPEQWLSPSERRRVSAARAAYADGRVGDAEPGSIVREA